MTGTNQLFNSCSSFSPLQYLPSTAVNTTVRLQELRALMSPLNISAYIIPGTDAHMVHLLYLLAPSCARARV